MLKKIVKQNRLKKAIFRMFMHFISSNLIEYTILNI